MFTLISTFIATFMALCKGLMVLIGTLLGGAAFVALLGTLLVAGVKALVKTWLDQPASATTA